MATIRSEVEQWPGAPGLAVSDLDLATSSTTSKPSSGALAILWQDRGSAIALTLLVLVVTLVPPTAARLFGPTDLVHLGTYWYHEDFPVYMSAMQEAATSSSWLIHNHFTTEPHAPIMMFPLYVLIGKIAAFTGLPLLAVYAATELAARCVLAVVIYALISAVVTDPRGRRLGFILAVFSGGLGFWTGLIQVLSAASDEPPARLINTYVEATTLGAFLAAPHIQLGLASILAGLLAFIAALKGSTGGLAALAIAVLVLGLVHPFNTPVLLASFGAYAATRTLTDRRIPWRAVTATVVACAVGGPMVIYNYVTFTFAPVWSDSFGVQNRLPSPLPWELLLDYGVTLVLAPLGILAIRDRITVEQRVVLTFLAVIAVCIYLPVPYQRRFAFGALPALAAFAALGWPFVVSTGAGILARLGASDRASRTIARRVLGYSLIPAAFTTTVAAYVVILSSAISNAPLRMYSVDQETYAVARWIAAHSGRDDISLGSTETGAALAALIPGHVYFGHVGVTVHGSRKRDQAEALFSGQMNPDEARAFLESNSIDYVLVGPNERKLGSWDPGEQLGLEVAAREGPAIVYRAALAH